MGIRVVFDLFPAFCVDREQGKRLEVHVGCHAFCGETIDQRVPSGFIQPGQAQQVQMVGPAAAGIGSPRQAGGVPSRQASIVSVAQGRAPLEICLIAVQRRTAEGRLDVGHVAFKPCRGHIVPPGRTPRGIEFCGGILALAVETEGAQGPVDLVGLEGRRTGQSGRPAFRGGQVLDGVKGVDGDVGHRGHRLSAQRCAQ